MNDPDETLKRARDAGRLLARAFQAKLTPARDDLYGDLIKAYQSDPLLRELTGAFAEGLGVEIAADSTTHGLVLVANEDSPFVSKIADFQESMTQQNRITYGLLFVLLAAYVFPSVDALDSPSDEAPSRIELPAAVTAIRVMCEQALHGMANVADAKASNTHDADPGDAPAPVLGAAHLLALREVSRTADRSTLTKMLQKVCQYHVDNGLFQDETPRIPSAVADNSDNTAIAATYRPRLHYKIHIQHLARRGHRHLLSYLQTLAPQSR